MYVSIYGYTQHREQRKHLGNLTNIKLDSQDRVYDLSGANIEGKSEFSMEDALIYTVNTPEGRQLSAGFVRNAKVEKGTLVSFKGEDFKKVLDTDIMLDFTGVQSTTITLQSLMNQVAAAVQSSNQDEYMSHIQLQFIVPPNNTDVREIADYSGQYIIVNALKFLKVYLAFYGYYIKPKYDVDQDLMLFEFIPVDEAAIIEIKLKDFKHERVLNDIKLNKAVATIKFSAEELPGEWEASDQFYYNAQPSNNKASINRDEGLPPAAGYPYGFALETVSYREGESGLWEKVNRVDYDNAPNRVIKTVIIQATACRSATLDEAITAAGDPRDYPTGTVIKVVTAQRDINGFISICPHSMYIRQESRVKVYHYYRISDREFTKRPNLPERIYLLGKDNQIYEGYQSTTEDNRIYPVISKIFESTYLAEAQVNAVYELVNNRYVENIIIDNERAEAPLNISDYELYQMFRVYDDEGSYKDLPLAEKIIKHEKGKTTTSVKLGFKKTMLTEVIKNDIGEGNLIQQGSGGGGGGGTQIIEEKYEIWDEPTPPPAKYDTWFKPLDVAPLGAKSTTTLEIEQGEDETQQIEVENIYGADGISQDDTPQQIEVENIYGADGISQDDTPQLSKEKE